MNLNGLTLLATLGERVGVDFWAFQTQDSRGIAKALDWLVSYSTGEKKWPYAQIEPYRPADLAPVLLRAAIHYRGANYRARVAPADIAHDVPEPTARVGCRQIESFPDLDWSNYNRRCYVASNKRYRSRFHR